MKTNSTLAITLLLALSGLAHNALAQAGGGGRILERDMRVGAGNAGLTARPNMMDEVRLRNALVTRPQAFEERARHAPFLDGARGCEAIALIGRKDFRLALLNREGRRQQGQGSGHVLAAAPDAVPVERLAAFRRALRATWAERMTALRDIWGVAVLVVVVLGGIYSGTFSVTESAAVALVYALLVEFLVQR